MQKAKGSVQGLFIEIMRKAIPSSLNLADEIASVLGISADSAYRRLRSETEFTISETFTLCKHFDIPLEALNAHNSNAVTFRTNDLSNDPDSFTKYLDGLYNDLSWLQKFEDAEVVYAAEDLPVFYSLMFPALARFKMCYWSKSILNVPEMQRLKMEDVHLPDTWGSAAGKIRDLFNKVKSIEIWSRDTLKSTIEQIRFYWESGFFREESTAIELIDELMNLVNTLEVQAGTGKKTDLNTGRSTGADYVLYFSELMIGNNCVMIRGEEKTACYIGYNTFNYMRTNGSFFNGLTDAWQKNLIAKSSLISMVSEKQRNQFFKNMTDDVENLRSQVLSA